jgi:hypothetical protein
MAQWDYANTIPVLDRFLAMGNIDDNQCTFGKLNLAAALVHEREHARAETLLVELVELARARGLRPILGSALELHAQKEIDQGRWARARGLLEEAERNLESAGEVEAFYVRKWRLINEVLSRGEESPATRLSALREEARRIRHWESLRDCDLIQATIDRDPARFVHLYFGTPFESFRRRSFLQFGRDVAIPDRYHWRLGPQDGSDGEPVRLFSADDGPRAGSIALRLAFILVSDFYRPFYPGHLHSCLYPGEHFNPNSSPGRVHQAVRTLRVALAKAKPPLEVEKDKEGGYRLTASRPCRLEVPHRRLRVRLEIPSWAELEKAFGEKTFSASEAATVLQVPARTLIRHLQTGWESGLIEREGAGNATRYRLKRS